MSRNKPSNKGRLLVITLSLLTALSFIFSAVACQQALKLSIATESASSYDDPTTELIAAKPSRHPLAIFMPKICLTTNQQFYNGINKNTSVKQASLIYSASHSAIRYGGLIEPNTIPLAGNKLSRLLAVVDARSPFFVSEIKLTKLIGGHHYA